MFHPFQSIPNQVYGKIFWSLFFLSIFLLAVFQVIPLPDIVQFELNAAQVIKSWDEAEKIRAAFSLGLDFLFIVVYSNTLSLGCIYAANIFKQRIPLESIGILLAWAQWLAALLDIGENIFLLNILFISVVNPWSQLARWCAIFKFILILVAVLYTLSGFAVKKVAIKLNT